MRRTRVRGFVSEGAGRGCTARADDGGCKVQGAGRGFRCRVQGYPTVRPAPCTFTLGEDEHGGG